ncbi:hypothetical protein AUP68_16465 [Ilyonectria robusta]
MVDYSPSCRVDPDFGPWYFELLRNNEDPTTTSTYTDFFAPNGSLIVLGSVATGANAILSARAAMLPADGSVQWNTLFTVAKDPITRRANLALQGGGLLAYDGFSIESSDDPCTK